MLMHAVHRAFAGRFYQVARPAYFASATSSSQMAEPAAMEIAVVGAHLTGMPLNHQLTGLGATLVKASKTAPVYRMFALNTQPPKPALIRVPPGQVGPLDIEIWSMPLEKVGYFLRDGVKAPLCLGDLLLGDNTTVKGFLGEPYATEGCKDVTAMGGWRAYMAARNKNTDVKEVEAKKADGGAGKAAAEQKQPGGGGVGEVAKAMGFVALGAAAGFGFFKATAKK